MHTFLIPTYLAVCNISIIFFILNRVGGYHFTLCISAVYLLSN